MIAESFADLRPYLFTVAYNMLGSVMDAGKPRFDVPLTQQEALVTQFTQACVSGDLGGLMQLLAEDIEAWSDGGSQVTTARNVIHGREKVARFLFGVMRFIPEDASSCLAMVNGQLGIVATMNDRPLLVLALEMRNGRIQAIRSVLNPDKLIRSLTMQVQSVVSSWYIGSKSRPRNGSDVGVLSGLVLSGST